MAERIYPKGVMCFKASDKAPEFILGAIVITLQDFKDWVNTEGKEYLTEYNGKKQIRLTVLQSDKSGINLQVDTYKPQSSQQTKIEPNPATMQKGEKTTATARTPNAPKDLPF